MGQSLGSCCCGQARPTDLQATAIEMVLATRQRADKQACHNRDRAAAETSELRRKLQQQLAAHESWPRWTTHLPALAPSPLASNDTIGGGTNAAACCQAPRPGHQSAELLALLLVHTTGLTRASSAWLSELQDRVALYTLAVISAADQSPYEHAHEILRESELRLEEMVQLLRSLLLPAGVPLGDSLMHQCMVQIEFIQPLTNREQVITARWVDEYNRRAAATGQPTLPESIRNDENEMAAILHIVKPVVKLMLIGLDRLVTVRDLQFKDDQLCQILTHFFGMQADAPIDGEDANQQAFEPFVPDGNIDRAFARTFEPGLASMIQRDQTSWYHSPEKVDYWASQYAEGRVSEGDSHFWQRYHIRPVQHYGIYRDDINPYSELGAVDAPFFLGVPLAGGRFTNRHEYVSFDIVDASGRVWPIFVAMWLDSLGYTANFSLRSGGDCADDGHESQEASPDSARWSRYLGVLRMRGDLKRVYTYRLSISDEVAELYKPWGLFAAEEKGSKFKSKQQQQGVSEVEKPQPPASVREHEIFYTPSSCSTVKDAQRFGGRGLEGCHCPDPLSCAAQRAGQLEFQQLLAVALDLILGDHPPALFSANHPLAARVQFTYTVLMRMFNPTAEDLVAAEAAAAEAIILESISFTPTSPPTWLPNVLLEIIAEYAPIDQLPFVTV